MTNQIWDSVDSNDITRGKKLIALGYNEWLKNEQTKRHYQSGGASYADATIKQFLVDYKQIKLKEWNEAKAEHRNSAYYTGHSIPRNQNPYNFILSGFFDLSDEDILNPNKGVLYVIDQSYICRNQTYKFANNIKGPEDSFLIRSVSSMISRASSIKELLKPSDESPSKPPEALKRIRSAPNLGSEVGNLDRSNPRSHASSQTQSLNRSRSAPNLRSDGKNTSYLKANPSERQFLNEQRFEKETQYQESKKPQSQQKEEKSETNSKWFEIVKNFFNRFQTTNSSDKSIKTAPTKNLPPANKSSQHLCQNTNRSRSMRELPRRRDQQPPANNRRSKSMNSTTGLEQPRSRRDQLNHSPTEWTQRVSRNGTIRANSTRPETQDRQRQPKAR